MCFGGGGPSAEELYEKQKPECIKEEEAGSNS